MTSPEAIQAERQRRVAMWDAVQRIQQERPLTADEVREIGCYNGARGIWRDKGSTAHLTESSNGVCVGISSRGKYEDEIGEETGTYDYPATQATTYDQGDIDAMRAALSLGMPLFLIRDTNAKGDLVRGKGPRRRVDRVEFVADDPLSRSLVFTFSTGGIGTGGTHRRLNAALSTTPLSPGAMIIALRGKRFIETRPSNAFHQKPTEVQVLHRSTPFSWHFSADDRHDLRIFCSVRGTFDLCRRVQIGAMCWETRTLSSHQTLEQAVEAAEALAAVPCQ